MYYKNAKQHNCEVWRFFMSIILVFHTKLCALRQSDKLSAWCLTCREKIYTLKQTLSQFMWLVLFSFLWSTFTRRVLLFNAKGSIGRLKSQGFPQIKIIFYLMI